MRLASLLFASLLALGRGFGPRPRTHAHAHIRLPALGSPAELEAFVQGLLLRSPFVESRVCVSDDMRYSSDLLAVVGAQSYGALAAAWHTQTLPALARSRCSVLRVRALSESRALVSWNVSFVPESAASLVALLERAPGVRVSFFDTLSKIGVRSSFSWTALFRTLWRLASTGTVALPHAVILGSSDMTFALSDEADPSSLVLVKQRDSLSLVKSFDEGKLLNRKITYDLLEFLDASRPPFVEFGAWNSLMSARVDTGKIPGMGQFDIDGLEGSQQENVEAVSANVLRLALPALLAIALFSTFLVDNVFNADGVNGFDCENNFCR